jgi:hypothetical protein
MSDILDRSLIRNLVREVISEVIAGEVQDGQTPPAKHKPVVEEVKINNDDDLSRFVKHMLALSKNTESWLAVEEGAWQFRFKRGDGNAAQSVGRSTTSPGRTTRIDKGVVSETRITTLAKEGVSHILLDKSAVLTPLGRDKARQLNISVEREKL